MFQKRVFGFIIFISITLLAASEKKVSSDNWSSWDKKKYETLIADLSKAKKNNSDESLELAGYLMEKYPDKEAPYQIAANIYILKSDFEAAESTYLKGIKNVKGNQDLYLKLAHFYKRKMPSKLDTLIKEVEGKNKSENGYKDLLSKLYIIADRKSDAGKILKDKNAKGDSDYFSVKSAVDILLREGKPDEAAGQILNNIYSKKIKKDERLKLFKQLLGALKSGDEKNCEASIKVFKKIIEEADDYQSAKEIVRDCVPMYINNGLGNILIDKLKGENSDASKWVYINVLQIANKVPEAASMLKSYEGNDYKLLEDKARMLSQSEDSADKIAAIETRRKLCSLYPKDAKLSLSLAQILTQSNMMKESADTLLCIDINSLGDQLKVIYFALAFENNAALKDYDKIVEFWNKAGGHFEYPHLEVFKTGVFGKLPLTDQHKSLLAEIEKYLKEKKDFSPAIYLLMAWDYEQLRDFKNYYKALNLYFEKSKKPDNDVIFIAVKKASEAGLEIKEEDGEEKLLVKDAEFLKFVVKWSDYLISQHPDIPDYYVGLMNVYKAEGKSAEIEKRLVKISEIKSVKPNELHSKAYILARCGYPEKALPLYEKAISLSPDNINYRVNYAGCLIRGKDYDKAIKVYTGVLLDKSAAQIYDLGLILRQIGYCYQMKKDLPGFWGYLNNLKNNDKIKRNEFYYYSIGALAKREMRDEAKQLSNEFIMAYPNDPMLYDMYFKLAEIYIDEKNFDKAIEVFNTCEKVFANDKVKVIDAAYNIGEMERRKGNFDGAIKAWTDIAKRYPEDIGAQNALYNAAYMAENDKKDLSLAKELYKQYLALKPGDIDNLKSASEKYKKLSEK